ITWHRQDVAGGHIERLVDADSADALTSLHDQKVLLRLDGRLPQSKEPAEVDHQARRSMQIDNPQDLRVGSGKGGDGRHGDHLLDLFHRQGTDQAVDDERHQVLPHYYITFWLVTTRNLYMQVMRVATSLLGTP